MRDILRSLRCENKLTQEEVAFKLNVSAQTVSKWERGLSSPSLDLIPKIAMLYGCSIDTLFGVSKVEKKNVRRVDQKNILSDILENCYDRPEVLTEKLKEFCLYIGREEYLNTVTSVKKQLSEALDIAEKRLTEVIGTETEY